MPADYGLIRATSSAEGKDEQMDCYVGPNHDSRSVWVIDQCDPDTRQFDEHKVMLGFDSAKDAVACYLAAFSSRGVDRIMGISSTDVTGLKDWLKNGDVKRPMAPRRRAPELRAA